MTGIGVGRSLKDLVTDRGAETYDYNLPYESGPKMSNNVAAADHHNLEAEKEALDDELQEYWNNKRSIESRNAIQAGKKRSVKERLGTIRASPEGTENRPKLGNRNWTQIWQWRLDPIWAVDTALITVWKFHDFSITQILRKINFGNSRSAKSAILPHLEAVDFDF